MKTTFGLPRPALDSVGGALLLLFASFASAEKELASKEVTGESGGGMVSVVMRGTHEVSRITIDPGLVGEDVEMLEDLVAAAVNDAVNRVAQAAQERMAGMTEGIQLPPGMKLPF